MTSQPPPIWRSQPPAIRARTPSSSTSTMRAPRTATQRSVACTSCPPGRAAAPRQVPGRVFRRVAHVEQVGRRGPRSASSAAEARGDPARRTPRARREGRGALPRQRRALRHAGRIARRLAAVAAEAGQLPSHGAVAQRHDPVRHAGRRRHSAPMMERVRPAQLTTTVVSRPAAPARRCGTPARRPARRWRRGWTCARNSSMGRLSSTTMSAPERIIASSSAGSTEGVPYSCSTHSPKALDGTLTPENSTNPAASQAGVPPASTADVGAADAFQAGGQPLRQPALAAVGPRSRSGSRAAAAAPARAARPATAGRAPPRTGGSGRTRLPPAHRGWRVRARPRSSA